MNGLDQLGYQMLASSKVPWLAALVLVTLSKVILWVDSGMKALGFSSVKQRAWMHFLPALKFCALTKLLFYFAPEHLLGCISEVPRFLGSPTSLMGGYCRLRRHSFQSLSYTFFMSLFSFMGGSPEGRELGVPASDCPCLNNDSLLAECLEASYITLNWADSNLQ